jgi:hypothetical protein
MMLDPHSWVSRVKVTVGKGRGDRPEEAAALQVGMGTTGRMRITRTTGGSRTPGGSGLQE